MAPLNLSLSICLQHLFLEHLFNVYYLVQVQYDLLVSLFYTLEERVGVDAGTVGGETRGVADLDHRHGAGARLQIPAENGEPEHAFN